MLEPSHYNLMKTQNIELNSNNSLKKAAEMETEELTMWFAFCNALKFVNIGEDIFKETVAEHDIPYKAIYNYVQTVSGDIKSCLNSNGGIPMKYALESNSDEARNIEEIDYHFT